MAEGRGTGGSDGSKPERRSVNDRRNGAGAGSTPRWKHTGTNRADATSNSAGNAKKSDGAKAAGAANGGKAPKKGYKGKPYQEPNRFWNYPRPNKGPIHRWLPSWRFLLGSILTLGLLGVILFVVAYVMISVPEPDDFALSEESTVYYADGETPMGTFAEVNRQIIDTDELPEHVGQAVVASEDQRFYSNVGVDPVGILRALWNNLTTDSRQGASTLTMQYVERYYTGQTDGYLDKFREAILALKIDQQQGKDEILANYMNTIYFGRGAFGIERASQEYFGHSASDLTLSESALIAGIIPSPGNWDPQVSPDMAEQRWQRTLHYMVGNGYITQAEADEQEFPDTIDPKDSDTYSGPNGYLLSMIRNELVDNGFSKDEIDGGGLQIVSTIDPEKQEAAVEAAEDLPEDKPDNVHVALTSIDNETGGILALYGGHDYLDRQSNNATQDRAQGGSTFKAFGLIAALENGGSLEERFPSYSPMTVGDYTITNFDSIDRGNIDLVTATQHSVNSVFVQLNAEYGPDQLVDVATRLGLPEDTRGLEGNLANVLGTASPHPADLAEAYATIGSGGTHHDRHIVASVTSPDGETVYTPDTSGERVVDAQVIADATYAMQQVVQGGTGQTASQIGRPAAGKTGSSNDYKSAWFSGFVPQMTTTVAMYKIGDDGEELPMEGFGQYYPIYGGSYPTDIWTEYMTQAVQDLPVEEFPPRSAPDYSSVTPPDNSGEDSGEETEEPSEEPSEEESEEPSEEPTEEESEEPSEEPSQEPTETPSEDSTSSPPPSEDSSGDSDAEDGGTGSGDDGGTDQGSDAGSGDDGEPAGGGTGRGAGAEGHRSAAAELAGVG